MSQESIQRIYDRFAAGIEQACASGRGQAHLHGYLCELGAELASAVFLAVEHFVASTDLEPDDALVRAAAFIKNEGIELLNGLAETFEQLGVTGGAQLEAAAMAAATAYRERIEELMARTTPGGAA